MRVFAGQDPASVWVGWVSPDYHYHSKNFSLSKTRTVTVTLGDERGRVHERQAPFLFISEEKLETLREGESAGCAGFSEEIGLYLGISNLKVIRGRSSNIV